jgi:hypothetical protein
MNFGQWMAINIPPEKLFKLEEDCRRLENAAAAKLPAAATPPISRA